MGVIAAILLLSFVEMGTDKVNVIEPAFQGACSGLGGTWYLEGQPGANCQGINWKEHRDD